MRQCVRKNVGNNTVVPPALYLGSCLSCTYLGLPSRIELYERRAATDSRLRIYQRPAFDDLPVLQNRDAWTYGRARAPMAFQNVNDTDNM